MDSVLVCLPVAAGPAKTPSITGSCSACQQAVWIAEAGQRQLQLAADTRVICGDCAVALLEIDPPEMMVAAPGALEAVERELGPNARLRAELMLGSMNRAARRRARKGKRNDG